MEFSFWLTDWFVFVKSERKIALFDPGAWSSDRIDFPEHRTEQCSIHVNRITIKTKKREIYLKEIKIISVFTLKMLK